MSAHERTDVPISSWAVVSGELAIFFAGCFLLYSRWFPDASGLLSLGLTILTVVLNLRIWVGGVLLLLVQWELFFRERPLPGNQGSPVGDMLWVMGVLLLLFVSSRLNRLGRELRQQGRPLPIRLFGLDAFVRSVQAILLDGFNQLGNLTGRPTLPTELAQAGRRILVPVIVATAILLFSPPEEEAVESMRLTPAGFRTLKIGLSLAGLFLGLSALFRSWEWKRMTPSQARVFLRGVGIGLLNPDFKMVIRRRLRSPRSTRVETGNPPNSQATPHP